MRHFWSLDGGDVSLCTSEMDGRDIISLGAIPWGRDEGKITYIDRTRRVIKREGNENEIPFPDKFYTKDDVNAMRWEVCRIGTHRQKGHEDHA